MKRNILLGILTFIIPLIVFWIIFVVHPQSSPGLGFELFVIYGSVVPLIFMLGFLSYKVRIVSFIGACVFSLGVSGFFTATYFYEQYQNPLKEKALAQYLNDKYPNEKFVIEVEDSRFSNPYAYDVTFENEPTVKYEYTVGNKDEISQTGFSFIDGKIKNPLNHDEDNDLKE
ncbi:MAG: hypothetical protein ACI35O_01355 [Bacillaceae bacterium]